MELIKVSPMVLNGADVNSVNSRDIYEYLGLAKGQYSRWIKSAVEKYDFIEGEDFVGFDMNVEGTIARTYFVTLDMAKELCMISDSKKGKEIRKYFIECEKKALFPKFSIPKTYSEALLLASKQAEQIEQQKELIAIQAPKVDFYEAVTGSSDTIDIGTVAKVLNIDGYGRTRLFSFLRDKGILRANNEPYQTYCDRGYFRVIESKFSKPDGSTHVSLKTVVYQKGVDYIRKLVVGAQ